MSMTPRARVALRLGVTASLSCLALPPLSAHELPEVRVSAEQDPGPQPVAASQGHISAAQIQRTVFDHPGQVLDLIPGMVVTQHSGEGKANQYILRGFNLDHGTDFAIRLQGVPLNMPSHAHGQGYADLHLLIPELVARIDFRKGPYFAAEGDFSSAGSADIQYRSRLERPLTQFSIGPQGYLRVLAAQSVDLQAGLTLLGAIERVNDNGPWTTPEGLRKSNALFLLSSGGPREGHELHLSAYDATWRATDQVPQRLLNAGVYQGQAFGRFDTLDPGDGGGARRYSFSAQWHRASDHAATKVTAYLVNSTLGLFSDFTYQLQPQGDQFGQSDQRTVAGGSWQHSWLSDWGDDRFWRQTLGLQFRHDQIRAGLTHTQNRQWLSTVRDDAISQDTVGLHLDSEVIWNPWLRTTAGLRLDQLHAQVRSLSYAPNSGAATATRASPKWALTLGPWHHTELFFNAGMGFHSNDARGIVARYDPQTLAPLSPATGLVGSRGSEVGAQSQLTPAWLSRWAWWRLSFDSELVYQGDTGTTVAGRPSLRSGLEWSNRWQLGDHYYGNADFAWTRARYTDAQAVGAAIVNTAPKVAQLSWAMDHVGHYSSSLSWRYIAAMPLVYDASLKSPSTINVNGRVMRHCSEHVDLALDLLNLTQRQNTAASYYYTSRLPGEPTGGVGDVHLHPAAPRTLRLTLIARL
jgi:hypothetical protein